jgi:hypothetical protein
VDRGQPGDSLVDGAEYFARLLDHSTASTMATLLLLADWRGDADERLGAQPGTELTSVLSRLARPGADVRGLVWRSYPDQVRGSEQQALRLAEAVNEAGDELLLDRRVRRGGSHHQRLALSVTLATRTTTSRSSAASTCAMGGRTTGGTWRPAGRRPQSALPRAAAVARRPGGAAWPGHRRPVPHLP